MTSPRCKGIHRYGLSRQGQTSYLDPLAEVFIEDYEAWQKLPKAVRTGQTKTPHATDVADKPVARIGDRDRAAVASGCANSS